MSNPRGLRDFRVVASALILALLAGMTVSASAASTVHVSFVMFDPSIGKAVGAGNQAFVMQVNHNDRQRAITDGQGVVSFDIAPLDYIFTWYCNSCRGDYPSSAGTQYLVSPQLDGSVRVLGADGEVARQDASGNFITGITLKRTVAGSDPWQRMSNLPNFQGGAEHLYLMTNGTVLMQSRDGKGFDKWWLLTPDANGSYIRGAWAPAAQPPAGYNPQNMNGAVLHSGRFMIVGGEQNTNAAGVMEDNTNQSYIYDVVGNAWTAVAPPNGWTEIGAAPFVALADGRIMVGQNGGRNFPGLNAMLYDESTSNWTLTGTNKITSNNEEGYTLLPDGRVLNIWNGDDNPSMLGTAEIYDPATGLWSETPRIPVSIGHGEIGPALTMPNGKVLALGATGHNVLYDPASNAWSAVPDFPTLANGLQPVAADNEAVVLTNGNVLVVTSVFVCSTQNCYFMAPARWLEYDVASNTWLSVPEDPIAPSASTIANGTQALPLPNGQIMVTQDGNICFYTPSGVTQEKWQPIVDSLSSTSLAIGTEYTIKGKQLSGLTQGAHWGDEQQNATNYPLVQLTNTQTRHVSYARTYGFSNTSIAPLAPSNFTFALGPGVENGPSTLRVIASGFASAPVAVTVSGGVPVATPTPTPTPTPTATPVPKPIKKITITCVKGRTVKKVTAVKPKCPAGYLRR